MATARLVVVCTFLLSFVVAVSSLSVHVQIDDPNIYFSELNWFRAGASYAQTNNPGAYFKTGFTGSQVNLVLNQSSVPTTPYATIVWSIDDKPFENATLPTPSEVLVLANELPSGNHSLVVYLYNSLQTIDRWNIPSAVWKVIGFQLDNGATTVPYPNILPYHVLIYWDSIGEGVRVFGDGGNDLQVNAAPFDSQFALAAALNAELSLVAFGRQGYVTTGNGNVPQLFNPDQDQPSAWNMQDAIHPRSWSKLPDYIFCGHGTNDYGQGPAAINASYDSALGWLHAQRKVTPDAIIFLTIPFGGFIRSTLTSVFETYQTTTNDNKVFLIDLGPDAEIGLNSCGYQSKEASDCLHPLVWRNGQLGAMLAKEAALSGALPKL